MRKRESLLSSSLPSRLSLKLTKLYAERGAITAAPPSAPRLSITLWFSIGSAADVVGVLTLPPLFAVTFHDATYVVSPTGTALAMVNDRCRHRLGGTEYTLVAACSITVWIGRSNSTVLHR
jgi:hypothetical protein